MTIPIPVIDMYDTATKGVPFLPVAAQVAGYTTGSGIAWTAAQFAARNKPYPAVRIDQDAGASDPTADILDVENGAATVAEVGHWITLARASFINRTRPGQRWPGIYCGLANLDPVIANLKANGIITGVPFGIPDLTNRADAVAKVSSATGPFPRVWQQHLFSSNYDSGIVSVPWLTKVSGPVIPNVTVPNLVGDNAGDAHNKLVALGLIPTAGAGQRATDIVTGTSPVAGAVVAAGTRVTILARVPHIILVVSGELFAPVDGRTFTVAL
jgi:hypothetical protein